MGNHFVPLLVPAKSAPAAFRLGAVTESTPGNAPMFTPISFGLPSLAANQPASASGLRAAASTPAEVSFKRDGDRITQIQIRCSCGECIILDCDYTNPTNT